jgi:hypothetical protein
MKAVVQCESQYVNGQSRIPDPNGPNGREDSWGYVQINLPWNPNISKEQALDPEFSIRFLAQRLSEGYGSRWTCYRDLYTGTN